MNIKIKYILVLAIMALVSVHLKAQNQYTGSWVITSSYWPEDNGNALGYKNFQLNFDLGGISNPMNPQELFSFENQNLWKYTFSIAETNEDTDLNFYLTDKYYYYNGEREEWKGTPNELGDFSPKAQIIKHPNSEYDYFMLSGHSNTEGGGHHYSDLFKTHITIEDDEVAFTTEDFNTSLPAYEYAIPIISNTIDNERFIYILFGYRYSNSQNGDYSDTWGLKKYKLDEAGILLEEDLLLDEGTNVFLPYEYFGYDIEMQDKNTEENTPIAWITSPLDEETINDKIYIYDETVSNNHYRLNLSGINTGRIAGIEFSPFPNEQDFLYLSTANLGLIKINWHTGALIEQIVANDYNYSYVQTAPDGNIYVVSNDGISFGQISKQANHLFNPHAFQYPFYVNQNGIVTDLRLTHVNYIQSNGIGLKYYTLPENDYAALSVMVTTQNQFCDVYDGNAHIAICGGTKPYNLVVYDENGNDVSSLFVYNEELKEYIANPLAIGLYQYIITDNDLPANQINGTFRIEEEPIWDFEDNLLVINNQTAADIVGLEDLIWEPSDNTSPEPNEGFLIDATLMFKNGFKINNNTTLTINDMRLEFDQDYMAKVIVEPGSKLILNNSVLTNYHCSDTEAKWAGVQVWGNKNQEQTPEHQGKIVLNNSTIEHAHEAVQLWKPGDYNTTGGIIYAENSQFLNNHRAVSALSYKSSNIWGHEIDYSAVFKQCEFKNDNDYISDSPFYTFATLWKVKGVRFYACNFINSPSFPDAKAIYTLDAGYKLKGFCDGVAGPNGCTPQDWQTNSFIGFEKAIESANTVDPDVIPYAINIFDSYFYDNHYGVFMTTINNAATILNNEFKIGNNGVINFEKSQCGYFSARGIQMNQSYGFSIEENNFEKMQGSSTGDDVVGVLVYECPSELDDVYLNEFSDLTAGNQAEFLNRVDKINDHTGITYLCNNNQGNTHDFYVTDTYEGMINGHIGNIDKASGNTLSNTTIKFRNDGTQDVRYYYWPNEPSQVLPDLDPNDYVVPIAANNPNECLSNYGGGSGEDPKLILTDDEKTEKEQEFYQNFQDYEAVSSLLEQLTDGGSTDATNLTIASAQPSDTWALRANLLGMSPYLSKEVLIEAADRTDVLPESVLFEILSANPEELRKSDLMDHLENKAQPLPDYMISILRQMSNGTSAKTAMLNQKASYYSKKTNAIQAMIRSIKNEDELDIIALRNWLGNMENINADKQIVSTYLYEDNYTAANNLLNLIPDLYNLEGEKLQAFNDFKDLLNLQVGLKQQDRNIFTLNDSEKLQLLSLAENSTGNAKYGARNILSFVYGDNYCDCITPIEGGGNKSTTSSYVYSQDDIANAMGLSINIKPNPASVYSSIDYTLPIGVEHATLQLINVEGKIVYSQEISGMQGQTTLDVRAYKSGTYVFRLETADYNISKSTIIQ